MNLLLISEYPSMENPAYYSFIKHRVDALKDKYDITVLTFVRTTEKDQDLKYEEWDGYTVIRVNIKDINIPVLRHLYFDYQVNKTLRKIIPNLNIDLIEVHFSQYYSWIVSKYSEKFGIPFNIVEHSSRIEKKINQVYYGKKIKRAYKSSIYSISVSDYLKNKIKKYIDEDIIVVPNIVNTKQFNITKPKETEVPTMVTVGILDYRDKKGYLVLIDALEILHKKKIDFNCLIIGEGPNYENVQNIIKSKGLSKKIKLLGRVSNTELPKFYNSSDFFVSTSYVETFGVAILEAMSCGLPVVSTKSGGPEEFISSEIGLLCEVNKEDIASKIMKMIKNYNKYNQERIRQKVLDEYSEEYYINQMKCIYEDTIKKNKRFL